MPRGTLNCRCGYELVTIQHIGASTARLCCNPVHPRRPKCPKCGDSGPHSLLTAHMRCRICNRTFDPKLGVEH